MAYIKSLDFRDFMYTISPSLIFSIILAKKYCKIKSKYRKHNITKLKTFVRFTLEWNNFIINLKIQEKERIP